MKFAHLLRIFVYGMSTTDINCIAEFLAALLFYVNPNRYADQMYEDLLYYYNKNVRPVKNASESVKVKFGSSLIRLIDVVSLKSC